MVVVSRAPPAQFSRRRTQAVMRSPVGSILGPSQHSPTCEGAPARLVPAWAWAQHKHLFPSRAPATTDGLAWRGDWLFLLLFGATKTVSDTARVRQRSRHKGPARQYRITTPLCALLPRPSFAIHPPADAQCPRARMCAFPGTWAFARPAPCEVAQIINFPDRSPNHSRAGPPHRFGTSDRNQAIQRQAHSVHEVPSLARQ